MLQISIFLTLFGCFAASDSFLTFAKCGLGVNFGGFSAGLNKSPEGKIVAHAGTPWGAAAESGIGGYSNAGGLYAGATAGGDISAAAGLEGGTYGGGSYGSSYAGASAAGKKVEIIKDASSTSDISGSFAAPQYAASYTKSFQLSKKPIEVGVAAVPVPLPPPEPKPVTTVIQKTVIPNYEKKIIKVPSYEEKVVRVPTVVEKEVWVPAPPTVIEKEVIVPQPPPPPVVQTFQTVPVIYKTRLHKHPHFFLRKHFSVGNNYGSGYAGAGDYAGVGGAQASATISKNVNPDFYNDVFNIPISTLGAVKNFVSGLSTGGSASFGGSLDVSKSIGVSKSVAVSKS